MLHVWNIYLHDWVMFRANVGKYSMEHMGMIWGSYGWFRGCVSDLYDEYTKFNSDVCLKMNHTLTHWDCNCQQADLANED